MASESCICIIDDDESFRDAIGSLLALLGYRVDAFGSAEAFLASESMHRAACVISDVQMSGMNGLELHRQLLQAGRHTPFILMTAYPDDATRRRALRDGCIGFIEKPMQQANLLACLEKAGLADHP